MGQDDFSWVKRISICCAARSSTARCCERSLQDSISDALEWSCALRSDDTNGASLRASEGWHAGGGVDDAPGWTLPAIMNLGGDSWSNDLAPEWTPVRASWVQITSTQGI